MQFRIMATLHPRSLVFLVALVLMTWLSACGSLIPANEVAGTWTGVLHVDGETVLSEIGAEPTVVFDIPPFDGSRTALNICAGLENAVITLGTLEAVASVSICPDSPGTVVEATGVNADTHSFDIFRLEVPNERNEATLHLSVTHLESQSEGTGDYSGSVTK